MFTFADVMHLLADELARLCRWCLPGALVCAGAFDCFFLGHTCPPSAKFTQPECHVDAVTRWLRMNIAEITRARFHLGQLRRGINRSMFQQIACRGIGPMAQFISVVPERAQVLVNQRTLEARLPLFERNSVEW